MRNKNHILAAKDGKKVKSLSETNKLFKKIY